MSEENQKLKKIIEGAILATGEALSVNRLQALFTENEMPEKDVMLEVIEEIKQDCEGRGFELVEVASGYRFNVVAEVAPWVNKLWDEKPQKYSRALLETLALVAYRQPITRGDIEEVRGVAVSSHIIKTLTEREWVKVVGHRDVPGRPALYATTKLFLDYFNLKNLEDLPSLGELKDIDSLNQNLEFSEAMAAVVENMAGHQEHNTDLAEDEHEGEAGHDSEEASDQTDEASDQAEEGSDQAIEHSDHENIDDEIYQSSEGLESIVSEENTLSEKTGDEPLDETLEETRNE